MPKYNDNLIELVFPQSIRDSDTIISEIESGPVAFIYYKPASVEPLSQGWKAHLSCSTGSIQKCLDAVAPFLVRNKIPFKFPKSIGDLEKINSGEAGSTQTGKAITIYYDPIIQHLPLISAIGKLWPFTNGPKIIGEAYLPGHEQIFFRYGAIASPNVCADEIGALWPAIKDPQGNLIPDRRGRAYPSWIDPLSDLKIFDHQQTLDRIASKLNICLVGLKSTTTRSSIYLASSLLDFESRYLKVGYQGNCSTQTSQSDQALKINREGKTLNFLKKRGYLNCPSIFASYRSEEACAILLEIIDGTGAFRVEKQSRLKCCLQLIEAVYSLHKLSISHNDIKPTNILVTKRDTYLIDFELSTNFGDCETQGTEGYSTDQIRHVPVGPSRDLFALIKTITSIFLGYDVHNLPLGSEKEFDIVKLFGGKKSGIFYQKLLDEILKIGTTPKQTIIEFTHLLFSENRNNTVQINYSLNTSSISKPLKKFLDKQGAGYQVKNSHIFRFCNAESINIGSAGILIALLSHSNKDESIISSIADELSQSTSGYHSGLFTGDAGVSLALALAFKKYRVDSWRDSSIKRFEAAIDNINGYDFFSGAAGIIYGGLLIEALLDEPKIISKLSPIVRVLLKNTRSDYLWESNSRLDSKGIPQLGAAHGAAGIALSLAVYGSKLKNEQAVLIATKSFESINRFIRDNGIPKSINEKTPALSNIWCHGSMGVLWCLLMLEEYFSLPSSNNYIKKACEIYLESDIWSNPTMCHGLSGQLEILRMLKGQYVPEIMISRRFNLVVNALHSSIVNGKWSSEDPKTFTPDLWVGFSGPALQLDLAKRGITKSIFSKSFLVSI